MAAYKLTFTFTLRLVYVHEKYSFSSKFSFSQILSTSCCPVACFYNRHTTQVEKLAREVAPITLATFSPWPWSYRPDSHTDTPDRLLYLTH